jgi:hypothetical protein
VRRRAPRGRGLAGRVHGRSRVPITLVRPVEAECRRQEHRHLSTRDRRVRTIVAAAATRRDACCNQGLDEPVKWVTDRNIRKGRCRRRRTYLQAIPDPHASLKVSLDSHSMTAATASPPYAQSDVSVHRGASSSQMESPAFMFLQSGSCCISLHGRVFGTRARRAQPPIDRPSAARRERRQVRWLLSHLSGVAVFRGRSAGGVV